MWHLNYNLHDVLKIRVTGNKKFDFGRKLKWLFFEGEDEKENPDITLNIGKFRPSNNDCDVVAHKYHVKENYFYCKDKGKKIKWEVEIFGFEEGKTVINFNGKDSGLKGILFPSFLAQEFLIPLIEYKLAQKDHFLLHAGAISKNSNAFIFAGRGGAFKTTLIMDFIRKAGVDFLGDDRIIINEKNVLSFPRILFFFYFMLKNRPTEECSFFDKARSFKYLILKKYKTKVPLIDSSKLKSLFFVSRADRNTINKKELTLKEGIDRLVINNKAEFVTSTPITPSGQFYKYMLVYSLIFPDNRLAKHWGALMRGLEEVLKGLPMYVIEMPYEYDLGVFDEVFRFVQQCEKIGDE